MELAPYVDTLRHELSVAAAAAGEDARSLAERLTGALDAATRLVLLEALSAAADEITRDLAPGSVEVRLRGRNPSFVVTPPPTEESFDDTGASVASPTALTDSDDGGTSRIGLSHLADPGVAAVGGLRVGVAESPTGRAVAAALDPDGPGTGPGRRSPRGGQRYTGWVR